MNAQITRRSPLTSLAVAAGVAGLLLVTSCSSDSVAPTSTPAPVPSSVSTADAQPSAETSDSVTGDPAATDPATTDETGTDPAPGDGTGGDVSTDGVCALATPAEISGILQTDFNSSTVIDSGTVPECLFSSTMAANGASIGMLTGGKDKLDEQLQIVEMTSNDGKKTQEKVNGADATMYTFTDLVGYPEAKIMMVQGDDLLSASVTGAMSSTPQETGKAAVILLVYLTSKTG